MRYLRSAGICLLFVSFLSVPAVAETQTRVSGAEPQGRRPDGANANGLNLEGNLTVQFANNGTVRFTVERVRNSRVGGTSGTLQLELWATTIPFSQATSGYSLAVSTLGQLNGGTNFANVDSGFILYSPPPSGTYYITIALNEFDGTRYVIQDFFTFSQLQSFVTVPACTPSSTVLCLNNGRFRVTAFWQSTTASGAANAVSLTSDTGYFWFFSSNNVEVVVKVVNGCSFNSRYWTFAGGLTNVDVTIQVTDTATGLVKSYRNLINTAFLPIQDTNAFATCP